MQPSLTLGRLFGIAIGLHYSWIIIAVLIALSLAGQFRATNSEWSTATVWVSALVTAALFFASIVVHELAHALMAQARGLPVRSITLFALGGVAQMDKPAADAKTEIWVAIVGPLTSLAIGVGCFVMAAALGWSPAAGAVSPATAILGWLGFINIALALFNMIPGFPLDGGRVLRGILWWITADGDRSTRIAARVGQAVAFGFIFLGIMRFFGGAGFGGLWLAFIGWFLLQAAQASYAEVAMLADLRGVRVGDLMARECPTVDPGLNVQTLVDDHLLRSGRRCFVVSGNGGMLGLITPAEIKTVDRNQWANTSLSSVMRPLGELRTVGPGTPAVEALKLMAREDVNQLPVVSEGRLEGIVSRSHILQLLQAQSELHR